MESGRYKLLLVVIIVLQIAGFTVLWLRIPSRPPGSVASVPGLPPANADSSEFTAKLPQDRILREAVASVLRQELAPYLAKLGKASRAGDLPGGTASTGALPTPDSAARELAAHRSRAVVDRALASGVWTDADSSALLRVAPMLSERQRESLLNKIFGAINNQQLKPVGSLPSL